MRLKCMAYFYELDIAQMRVGIESTPSGGCYRLSLYSPDTLPKMVSLLSHLLEMLNVPLCRIGVRNGRRDGYNKEDTQ